MQLLRVFKYFYLRRMRSKRMASLALSLALAHASFGLVKYKSLGNGMADITLALEDDQKFLLEFKDISVDKEYKLKGKWTVEDGNYVLKFRRAKPDLESLFSNNTGFEQSATVEGRKTVVFPKDRKGLMIWGIYCERSEE